MEKNFSVWQVGYSEVMLHYRVNFSPWNFCQKVTEPWSKKSVQFYAERKVGPCSEKLGYDINIFFKFSLNYY